MELIDRIEQLYTWLANHTDQDFSATVDFGTWKRRRTRDEVLDNLRAWFWTHDYKDCGYQFEWIGGDGAGSSYLVWLREVQLEDPPLVFFGVGGDCGVLARSAWDWPLILAHGVGGWEYRWLDSGAEGCAPVHPEDNEALIRIPQAYAKEALERYRSAVEEEYGDLPKLESLLAGRERLSEEFRRWVRLLRNDG